jgi:hypothetical protein
VKPKSRTEAAPITNQMTSTAVDKTCRLIHPIDMIKAASP